MYVCIDRLTSLIHKYTTAMYTRNICTHVFNFNVKSKVIAVTGNLFADGVKINFLFSEQNLET